MLLLQNPGTARTTECVTTTFVMESIIRRTIVVVEERVGGKLVNRTVNEVSCPLVYPLTGLYYVLITNTSQFAFYILSNYAFGFCTIMMILMIC